MSTLFDIIILNTPPGDTIMFYFAFRYAREAMVSQYTGKYWYTKWDVTATSFPQLVRAVDIKYDHYRPTAVDLYLRGVINRALRNKDTDTALACLHFGCRTILTTIPGQPRHTMTYNLLMMDSYRTSATETLIPFSRSSSPRNVAIYPCDVLVLVKQNAEHTKTFTKPLYSYLYDETIFLAARVGDYDAVTTMMKTTRYHARHGVCAMLHYKKVSMLRRAMRANLPHFSGELPGEFACEFARGDYDIEITISMLAVLLEAARYQVKVDCVEILVEMGKYKDALQLAQMIGAFRPCFQHMSLTNRAWSKEAWQRGWADNVSPETFDAIFEDSVDSGYWDVVEVMCEHPLCTTTSLITVVERVSAPDSMRDLCAAFLLERLTYGEETR